MGLSAYPSGPQEYRLGWKRPALVQHENPGLERFIFSEANVTNGLVWAFPLVVAVS
jgi:hypothetical protein